MSISIHKQLENACKEGKDYKLVYSLLKQGADVDWGLQGACQGGHTELVQLMIRSGARNFRKGLTGACEGGHKDLAQMMIQRGANNLEWGLHAACKNNHYDIANMIMIETRFKSLDLALDGACEGGHRDLVQVILALSDHDQRVVNRGLCGACRGGYSNLAAMMINNGATNFKFVFKKSNRFIFQVLLRIKKKYRFSFLLALNTCRSETKCYLINRITITSINILNYAQIFNRQLLHGKNFKTFNIIMQFTCRDVAIFTERFNGIFQSKRQSKK